MNYSVMTERETEIELSTSGSEGLSTFAAHDRLLESGRNVPEKTYSKSAFNVVLSQMKNLYTVAFFVMGIITALVDFKGSMGAWIMLFAVAVINMVSGFLRDNKERKIAEDFDGQRSAFVKIIRDGAVTTIDPTLLVRGDVVVLEEGDFVPADIRILSCENLKADESIFGDGVPKTKQSDRMEEEVHFSKCKNMLYSGTKIAQGTCVGAVVAIGKNTLISEILKKKTQKIDSHDKFAKNALSEKLLILCALIFGMVALVYMSVVTKNVKGALCAACTVALCVIPAPVGAVRLFTEKFFTDKIKKSGADFKEEKHINTLSELEYFLFDKGGILTDGDMDLEDDMNSDTEKLKMAVICSDCEVVNGKVTGSSIDMATVGEAEIRGIDVEKLLSKNKRIMYMPFDETRKLMAVLIENQSGGYRLIVKGSVEVIPNLCITISDGEDLYEMTAEALLRLEKISSSMAEKGLKIRAVAYRDIDCVPENIEDEIKNMIFAGAFGYREKVVKKSKDAIRKLESVYVKPIMVTGDVTITAATQAKLAGLIKKESECISFRELSECSDEILLEAAKKYKVFAAASGEDRQRLVKVLSEHGNVAVAGEQMTEDEVAVYANCVIADGDKRTCDISVKEENIGEIADVIYSARTMRGNMAYASFLGVSIGLAEALTLLWMMFFTSDFPYSAFHMLVLNIFVICAPCMILSVFARVKHVVKDRALLGAKCVLQALICTLFAIAARSNIIMYFAFYTLFNAGRICISFKNLEKGKPGGKGLVATLIVMFFTIVAANMNLFDVFNGVDLSHTVAWAMAGVLVNWVLSRINLKGIGVKNV